MAEMPRTVVAPKRAGVRLSVRGRWGSNPNMALWMAGEPRGGPPLRLCVIAPALRSQSLVYPIRTYHSVFERF